MKDVATPPLDVDALLAEAREALAGDDHRQRDLILDKLDAQLTKLEEQRLTNDSTELRVEADTLRRKLNHVRYVK